MKHTIKNDPGEAEKNSAQTLIVAETDMDRLPAGRPEPLPEEDIFDHYNSRYD